MELGERIPHGSETSSSGSGAQVAWLASLPSVHKAWNLQSLPTVDPLECQEDRLLVSERLFTVLSV